MSDFNPNIYWTVNGKQYSRKTEALKAATEQDLKTVLFHYYNAEFRAANWIDEPEESFEQLCMQRAIQLRETSKYLRLWYSGGADSHTMLTTFINANLRIDEIVLVRASPIDDFESEANRETFQRSMPYIDAVRNLMPYTKISVVDITADQYLAHYKKPDWYLETTNYDFSDDPGILLGSREAIAQHGGLAMNDDIVELTGGDKPRVIRQNGLYYAPIMDSQFSYLYWANVKEFFTTPEFPQLHVKQCHELKRIIKQHFPDGKDIGAEVYNPQSLELDFQKKWKDCCRRHIRKELDFGKGWSLISPKCRLRVYESMDKNPEIFKHFKGSLREFQAEIEHFWPDIQQGIAGILADMYCIGK